MTASVTSSGSDSGSAGVTHSRCNWASRGALSNWHSLVLDFDWANSNVLIHEDSLVIPHYPFRLQRNPSSSLAFCDLHIIDNDEDAVVVANDLWFFLVHISPPMKVCEL